MRWRLSSVARREYLELRQRRRMIEAVLVIERSYIQWKRRRYLNRLAIRLPSTSPTCREWPNVTLFLRDTNQILKKLYHVWRCHRYRIGFDQIGRNRMREKVTASLLFRNRKESYARSVAHPFQGDYVRLRQNSQWRKLVNETSDQYIVFADIVSKITRSSGRLVPVLFVVSTSSMMILDQRTLNIKYRVPAADIVRISLSPFLDDIAVFHVKSSSESSVLSPSFGNKWKGDLVLQTCHVIELVTKMFLVVQNAAGKAPEVNVHTDFEVSVGHQAVEFSFHCTGPTEVQPGHVRIVRRGYRLEVTL
ncbi:Myosin-IB [Daphnia magna]|uniref:Myosin-IB n=1 Tax=Daphnia magna TaxID=35525 RepID=A0A164XDN5_9CRUS|nr:Myosin-IB [Daphnia magna]